jgi:hypothetical protein
MDLEPQNDFNYPCGAWRVCKAKGRRQIRDCENAIIEMRKLEKGT